MMQPGQGGAEGDQYRSQGEEEVAREVSARGCGGVGRSFAASTATDAARCFHVRLG